MSIFLDAALAYAAEGIPVFPCVEGGKAPACPHGYLEATTDEAQIKEWWSGDRASNRNVAISPGAASLFVVDIDKHREGDAAWAALRNREDIPSQTYEVRTPNGGSHLYYLGDGPTTVDKLGKGIDTRGQGGYVLAPPSVVNGKPYVAVNDHDIIRAPISLLRRLLPRVEAVASSIHELDTVSAIARATDFLQNVVNGGNIARSGEGGNNRTYQVAATLRSLGLSPEKSRSLLAEIFNPHCEPPWSDAELEQICHNAAKYAQNEAGAYALEPPEVAFAKALPALLEKPKNRFMTVAEMATIPDPTWLVKDVLMERSTSLLVGTWRSYKSFIGLDLALSIATGQKSAFNRVPERTGPTIYSCREGLAGIAKVRRRGWCNGHGLEPDAAMPFYLGLSPLVSQQHDCEQFVSDAWQICGRQSPALVVVDTLSRSMAGLDEAKDAGSFLLLAETLVEQLNCTVLVLHHLGHDRLKGARGGTIYPASFDTYAEVEVKGAMRAEVWIRKQKDAPEPEQPFTMQGRLVPPSLCFYPTEIRAHNKATSAADPFGRAQVGQALIDLQAFGPDRAQSTHVLSQSLFPRNEGEAPDDYERRLLEAVKQLTKLSRTTLNAYCAPSATGPRWWMPENLRENGNDF